MVDTEIGVHNQGDCIKKRISRNNYILVIVDACAFLTVSSSRFRPGNCLIITLVHLSYLRRNSYR